MHRRTFIKTATALACSSVLEPWNLVAAAEQTDIPREFLYLEREDLEGRGERPMPAKPVFPVPKSAEGVAAAPPKRAAIERYLKKMRRFNNSHPDDIVVVAGEIPLLKSSSHRLRRVRSTVGFGNFYLTSLDDARKVSHQYPKVGAFPPYEIAFLEKLFYTDAVSYGFFGEKTLTEFSHHIPKKRVARIPGTGNFLYKGEAVAVYERLLKDIGPQAVLTSGVRSVMKQFDLFLRKAVKCGGNLSMASRSIAPPGYSYHGVSDFDIGQKGLGGANFTTQFTQTDVFKKMAKLEYLEIRYNQDNLLGVRFEPWHIKVDLA